MRIDQVLTDTQRTSSDPDSLDMVWWLVPQFWEAALNKDASVPPATRAEIVRLFTDNVVVAAVKGSMGTLTVESFLDSDALRERIHFIDTRGTRHAPLPSSKVDVGLQVMLGAMQPVIASVAGQLGEHLEFFVFPARDGDGAMIADPFQDGTLVVELDGLDYPFRLPLASVLEPRFDPDTGESFPGNYRYSPYTGKPLQPVAP